MSADKKIKRRNKYKRIKIKKRTFKKVASNLANVDKLV